MNFVSILVASVVPLFIGFVWYNPKVFGTIWMKEIGMTMDDAKGVNMFKMLGLTYIFSLLAAMMIPMIVIHQNHVASALMSEEGFGKEGSDIMIYLSDFMTRFGDNFRTFKHGALHGAMMAVFFALPVIGTGAIYERRSWKYIFIHVGYWFVSLAIMGGIVCAWK